MERMRVVVRGHVQGVGYRYAARASAVSLGVAGWVRNRADGAVEAEIEGTADAVASMLAWMRRGPSGARVDAVESTSTSPLGDPGFRIRSTT